MTEAHHTTGTSGTTNLPALIYQGEVINQRNEMLSLTDMWRAAGADEQKAPAKWRALPNTKSFTEHVGLTIGKSDSDLFVTHIGGRDRGTWAHWHIGMAYAKYLDHDFHMWCNTVVRERMEGHREDRGGFSQVGAAREARLFLKQAMGFGKMAGLTGNQLLIAANRTTKRAIGFDMLESMGITHLVAPVNDPLVIPSKIGMDLGGLSAVKVNHMLHEIGAQEGQNDHKGRHFWKPTAYGEQLGGKMVDVERGNGTGSAQQLKWPTSIVNVLRDYLQSRAS